MEPREVSQRTSWFKVVAMQPPGLDLTTIYQDGRPSLSTKAIYRLQSETLTYCVAAPGLPRPVDFVTRQGDGHTIVVLTRIPNAEVDPMATLFILQR